MNPPIEDLKDILVAGGFGTFGTNLFTGFMPETSILCTALFDIPGLSPDLHAQWERPAVQVRVRGIAGGYQAAYAKIKAITNYLHGRQETKNGTVYKLIQQEGDIFHITTDEKTRAVFAVSFQIQRTSE